MLAWPAPTHIRAGSCLTNLSLSHTFTLVIQNEYIRRLLQDVHVAEFRESVCVNYLKISLSYHPDHGSHIETVGL